MADPFVAEIRMFPYTFAPKGWAFCNGQLLPISQNTALFALLGTFYGGDGKSTFALPDLQDASPMHSGQAAGGSEHFLGEMSGSPFVTLLESEIPAHSHTFMANNGPANSRAASGNVFARTVGGLQYQAPGPIVQMAFESLAPTGGDQPHNNLMPYLVVHFCIALQGIFPARP
jgi:microcystin-dependent protein